MEKEIICTVCPMGCHITVTGEGDRVDSITGYTCKRGEEYGKQEFAHPVRILTSVSSCTKIPNGNPLKKNSTHFLLRMPMPESFQDFSWQEPAPARWTGREGS